MKKRNLKKKITFMLSKMTAKVISSKLFPFSMNRHRLNFDPSPKDAPKIIVYGDTRSQHAIHKRIVKAIHDEKPDMILFTGDMLGNSFNIVHWLIYTKNEHILWDNTEYYPTRGNHEEFLDMYKIFIELPNGQTYYSFDRGGMHFVVLDITDVYSPADPVQIEWLKTDLEKHKGKPISVSMHIPLFTSGMYLPYDQSPELLEIFTEYGVLFVFCAHCHSYERSFYNGVNYVVTAGGGAPLYPETRENPYKQKRVNNYHYCILTSEKGVFTLTVKDIDGNIIDTVTAEVGK